MPRHNDAAAAETAGSGWLFEGFRPYNAAWSFVGDVTVLSAATA
jgi:hypothetical protein